MRHQIRLLDLNLPGLTRELALACWRAVDTLVPQRIEHRLYRSLYRAIRDVFRARVQAFRFCGAAMCCEHSLEPRALVKTLPHERFPGERVHVYLTGSETTPEALLEKLVERTVRAVVHGFPKRRWPGLAGALRAQIEKVFHGRIFSSPPCGESPLCSMNEAIDPWDMREPANMVEHRS